MRTLTVASLRLAFAKHRASVGHNPKIAYVGHEQLGDLFLDNLVVVSGGKLSVQPLDGVQLVSVDLDSHLEVY